MPKLKDLTCSVQWAESGQPFAEHGTIYGDGVVETFIAVPETAQAFTIHLNSDEFIAQGLCALVYIDGNYQCNRSRTNLVPREKNVPQKFTMIDFLFRQKEKSQGGGIYMGRQWRFDNHNIVSGIPGNSTDNHFDMLGTIEVLVLRCRFRPTPDQIACDMSSESGADSDIITNIVAQQRTSGRIVPSEPTSATLSAHGLGNNFGNIGSSSVANHGDSEDDIEITAGLDLFDGASDKYGPGLDGQNPDPNGHWVWHQRRAPHEVSRCQFHTPGGFADQAADHQPADGHSPSSRMACPHTTQASNGHSSQSRSAKRVRFDYGNHPNSAARLSPQVSGSNDNFTPNIRQPPQASTQPQNIQNPQRAHLANVHDAHRSFTQNGPLKSENAGQTNATQPRTGQTDQEHPVPCGTGTQHPSRQPVHQAQKQPGQPANHAQQLGSGTGPDQAIFQTGQHAQISHAPEFVRTRQAPNVEDFYYQQFVDLCRHNSGMPPLCSHQTANVPAMQPDPAAANCMSIHPDVVCRPEIHYGPHLPAPLAPSCLCTLNSGAPDFAHDHDARYGGNMDLDPQNGIHPQNAGAFGNGNLDNAEEDWNSEDSFGADEDEDNDNGAWVNDTGPVHRTDNFNTTNNTDNVINHVHKNSQEDAKDNWNNASNNAINEVLTDGRGATNNAFEGNIVTNFNNGGHLAFSNNSGNLNLNSNRSNLSSCGKPFGGPLQTTNNNVNGVIKPEMQPSLIPRYGITSERVLFGPYGPYYSYTTSNLREPIPDAEEGSRYDVPEALALARGSTKQVQPGPGFLYYKKTNKPLYFDSLTEPYARFVFKYRTKDQLKAEIGVDVDTDLAGDPEIQSYQNMDREDLINMLIRAKGALGGQIPPIGGIVNQPNGLTPTVSNAAAVNEGQFNFAVAPPDLPFLQYSLPPARPAVVAFNSAPAGATVVMDAGTGNSNANTHSFDFGNGSGGRDYTDVTPNPNRQNSNANSGNWNEDAAGNNTGGFGGW